MKNLLKHKHKWAAIKTIWPYNHGYGAYCAGCKTLLSSGLTKEAAESEANELNKKA